IATTNPPLLNIANINRLHYSIIANNPLLFIKANNFPLLIKASNLPLLSIASINYPPLKVKDTAKDTARSTVKSRNFEADNEPSTPRRSKKVAENLLKRITTLQK
ncbi:hypothetical protein QR685DRAFT_441470, partial [Neurospora intermedia]